MILTIRQTGGARLFGAVTCEERRREGKTKNREASRQRRTDERYNLRSWRQQSSIHRDVVMTWQMTWRFTPQRGSENTVNQQPPCFSDLLAKDALVDGIFDIMFQWMWQWQWWLLPSIVCLEMYVKKLVPYFMWYLPQMFYSYANHFKHIWKILGSMQGNFLNLETTHINGMQNWLFSCEFCVKNHEQNYEDQCRSSIRNMHANQCKDSYAGQADFLLVFFFLLLTFPKIVKQHRCFRLLWSNHVFKLTESLDKDWPGICEALPLTWDANLREWFEKRCHKMIDGIAK